MKTIDKILMTTFIGSVLTIGSLCPFETTRKYSILGIIPLVISTLAIGSRIDRGEIKPDNYIDEKNINKRKKLDYQTLIDRSYSNN